MAKKVTAVVKLQIPAGQATPAPPVGSSLGPYGINIMEFVKTYNERTADKKGQIIPVVLTIYEDRSFTFVLKKPPVADLIKQKLQIGKGSATPKRTHVGTLTREAVREIAEEKMSELNAKDIEAAMRIVEGTARSMGVAVEA